MTSAYRHGAQACRQGIPFYANPHRAGTQSNDDWDAGHMNEAAGEHFRFGRDLVQAAQQGTTFYMDSRIKRTLAGDVDMAALQAMMQGRRKLTAAA